MTSYLKFEYAQDCSVCDDGQSVPNTVSVNVAFGRDTLPHFVNLLRAIDYLSPHTVERYRFPQALMTLPLFSTLVS